MRPHIAWHVFRKELRETLRDRRTLAMMVGLPLLLYPLMIMGVSALSDSQREASETRPSTIAIWGDAPPELRDLLAANKIVVKSTQPAPDAPPIPREPEPKEGEKRKVEDSQHPMVLAARKPILKREVDAVLVLWPDFVPSLHNGSLGHVAVLYDSVRDDSDRAQLRLKKQLDKYRETMAARREQERGLAGGFTRVMEVAVENVAPKARRTGFGLGQVLPFLLLTVSFTGAFYAAVDSTAGEKERNTLQTLMCAPLQSTEIIFGKFLAVWSVALITAMLNVMSMAVTFMRISASAGSLALSPEKYVLTFLMLIPQTLTIVAVFLTVGAFAKDFKEGQNYLTPVLMAMMMPSAVTMIPGIELNAWTSFAPVVNTALLIKAIMVGEASADQIFLVLLGSGIQAMLAIMLAARVFGREQVLLGGKDSFRGLFGLERNRSLLPSPALSFTLFAVALVAAFYGSLALTDRGTVTMLLTMEYVFFLTPAIAAALLMRFPMQRVFSLRLPSLQTLLASIAIGLFGWLAIGGVSMRLLPPPESLVRALNKILLINDDHVPLALLWFVVALTPAVCEELFFRGIVLSGLRPFGKWPAILISAALFGVAHASVYRLLPTFLLGILFGYLVWRSGSILTSIVAHALNNGLLVTIGRELPMESAVSIRWDWIFGASLVVVGALLLMRAAKPAPEAS
jgi:sodium transport system permease protein